MDYASFFESKISHLKSNGQYRYFANLERLAGQFPYATLIDNEGSHKVLIWCGNDYLGMGQHPKVIQAMQKTLDQTGAGSGGTRNISGTSVHHIALEHALTQLHDKEAALLFTSGYVANDTTLATLGKILPDCIFFSDSHNHASIINGIKHSGCEKKIFNHNDLNHLKQLLTQSDPKRPKIIVFESVYSMDGDTGVIKEICALAKQFNALTFLDEVHGVGMYGHKGGGIAQRDHVSDQVDIIQGTLGKAFGLMGGYITGSRILIDCIRSYAPGFIFTTSLSPVIAAGAVASINHLMSNDSERNHQQMIATYLKKALMQSGIRFFNSSTHIVPIIVGDAVKCKQLTDLLLDQFNIYIQPINYPTVAVGSERIRLTPSALHTTSMVDELVQALIILWHELMIPRLAA